MRKQIILPKFDGVFYNVVAADGLLKISLFSSFLAKATWRGFPINVR